MNNRQSGRRRGRNNNGNNNNRSQSGGGRGGVDQANRIDSRARGNAAQMIEKYRNLARDAQLSGDRVQTEYYLQFADHYFRVLSDFRARQEEKAAASGQERSYDRHRDIRGVEDFDGHDDASFEPESEGDDTGGREGAGRDNEGRDSGAREGGRERGGSDRRDEDGRGNRQQGRGNRRDRGDDRGNRADPEAEGGDEPAAVETAEDAAPAPRGNRRGPRRNRAAEGDDAGAGIDSAVLPPAIGRPERDAGEDAAEAPAPKPRRTRRTLAARDTGVEAAE